MKDKVISVLVYLNVVVIGCIPIFSNETVVRLFAVPATIVFSYISGVRDEYWSNK